MAHSFIQAYDDETVAFENFARSRPDNLTLLIDTYDTPAAARKVVALAPRLGADSIWWSFPLGSLASMLMAMGYYKWGGWRRARMLSTPIDKAGLEKASDEAAVAGQQAPTTGQGVPASAE